MASLTSCEIGQEWKELANNLSASVSIVQARA